MFRNFSGHTADQAWLAIADAFQQPTNAGESSSLSTQSSRAGMTTELMHATISIADPIQRWVVSRTPAINPAFAIAEVLWILSGRNDAEFVNYFNRALAKFSGNTSTYHGAYGYRLRQHFGVDQLDRAFRSLKSNPESRQVLLQTWDVNLDMPKHDGSPSADDIPCNVMSLLKIRSGALEWTQILRSNDIFRGVPYNFIQFTTLQEILAGWLGVKVGSYNHFSDSLHLYERDRAAALSSVPIAEIKNADSLALPKNEFDQVVMEIVSTTEHVISADVPSSHLVELAAACSLPTSYKNLLCVICAEGARRRGDVNAIAETMVQCRNPCLTFMFDRWQSRCNSSAISPVTAAAT